MGSGCPLTQLHLTPAGGKVSLTQPRQHTGPDVLMDAVHERLAGRMALEGAVDHTPQPVGQGEVLSGGSAGADGYGHRS